MTEKTGHQEHKLYRFVRDVEAFLKSIDNSSSRIVAMCPSQHSGTETAYDFLVLEALE